MAAHAVPDSLEPLQETLVARRLLQEAEAAEAGSGPNEVAAAVEALLAQAKSGGLGHLLGTVDGTIDDLLDVQGPYVTPFAGKGTTEQLEAAIRRLSAQIIESVDNHVVFDPDINQTDPVMSIMLTKVRADYESCLHDFVRGPDTHGLVDRAFQSYTSSTTYALDELPTTDVLRLSCALNFSMFCKHTLEDVDVAYETADTAYQAAAASLANVRVAEREVVAPFLQRMRDLLSAWAPEVAAVRSKPKPVGEAAQDHYATTFGSAGLPNPIPALRTTYTVPKLPTAALGQTQVLLDDGSARRPLTPMSHVLASTHSTPRQWMSALKARKRPQTPGQSTVVTESDVETARNSPMVPDADGVTLGQIEITMALMPRGEVVDVKAFKDSVTLIPPIHEIFNHYSPTIAASAKRVDGGTFEINNQVLGLGEFLLRAAGTGPTIRFQDILRFLQDFNVIPKLLTDVDVNIMTRMTIRGWPAVLTRKKPAGFQNRWQSASVAIKRNADVLIGPIDGNFQLTYPQFLDVLGRIAIAAFSVPPYRTRYETIADRIEGFLKDHLKLAESSGDWRDNLSTPQVPKSPKKPGHLGYMTSLQSGAAAPDFVLSNVGQDVLRRPDVERALQYLFHYYKRLGVPHGRMVLFADIAAGAETLDLPELMTMLLDFGIAQSMLDHREIEAIFRAVAKARQLGDKVSDAGARRHAVASTQSDSLDLDGFCDYFARMSIHVFSKPGSGAEVLPQADQICKMLVHMGVPLDGSRNSVTQWWGRVRAALAEGARAGRRRRLSLGGRPLLAAQFVNAEATAGLGPAITAADIPPSARPSSPVTGFRLLQSMSTPDLLNAKMGASSRSLLRRTPTSATMSSRPGPTESPDSESGSFAEGGSSASLLAQDDSRKEWRPARTLSARRRQFQKQQSQGGSKSQLRQVPSAMSASSLWSNNRPSSTRTISSFIGEDRPVSAAGSTSRVTIVPPSPRVDDDQFSDAAPVVSTEPSLELDAGKGPSSRPASAAPQVEAAVSEASASEPETSSPASPPSRGQSPFVFDGEMGRV